MRDIYRKVHLGIFKRPFLEVIGDEFIFRGKVYTREDITNVRIAGGSGSPMLLGVSLSDGKKILVNSGALELNGKMHRNRLFSGTNDAFEKLKMYFYQAKN